MTDARWIAFGDKLRQRRKAARITGTRLAEEAGPGWSPSKVSRIENGQQVITETDLATWCRIIGVSDTEAHQLADELRTIRLDVARYKQRGATGHLTLQRSFAEIEQAARSIQVYESLIVPGLVQTAEYARHVFTAFAEVFDRPNDVDQAVPARMRRQNILYEPGRTITLAITEAALRARYAPPAVMAGQIDRLISVLGLDTVRLGILPSTARIPVPVCHGFWILDDLLHVELLHTSVDTNEPADLKPYQDFLDQLWNGVLVEGEQARALLLAIAAEYR